MKGQLMLLAVSLLIVSIIVLVSFRVISTSTNEVSVTVEENYAALVTGVIISLQSLEGDAIYENSDFPDNCEVSIRGNSVSFILNPDTESDGSEKIFHSSIAHNSDIELIESDITCSDFKIFKKGNKISLEEID